MRQITATCSCIDTLSFLQKILDLSLHSVVLLFIFAGFRTGCFVRVEGNSAIIGGSVGACLQIFRIYESADVYNVDKFLVR